MKITIVAFLAIFIHTALYSQSGNQTEGLGKTETGFFYFVSGIKSLTFVPLKNASGKNDISNFNSDSLDLGYEISRNFIRVDSLSKYGTSYKLENFWSDTMVLTIVPVTLTYSLYTYGMTKKELEQGASIEKLQFSNRRVTFRYNGHVSMKIIASTLKLYYYDSLW